MFYVWFICTLKTYVNLKAQSAVLQSYINKQLSERIIYIHISLHCFNM